MEKSTRDTLADPQPGDKFHSPTFGGGATFTVTKRTARRGKDSVRFAIAADNGAPVEQRGRTYAVATLRHSLALVPA